MMKYPEWFKKGRIIKCPLDWPREKKKYCIILGYDVSKGEILIALINSKISKFIQDNSYLRELQVELKRADYPEIFSKTTSYVDCSVVRRKDLNILIEELENGLAKDCSNLKQDDKELIFSNVLNCIDIKTKDKLYIRSILPRVR